MKESDIHYSYSQAVPVKYALENFSDLSFPNLKTRIINNKITNPLLAVMAKKGDEIIGLSLASRQRQGVSDILTLLVKSEHRRKGIGSKMISQMNKIQAENGHKICRIFYFDHWNDNAFLNHLTKRHFWSSPQTKLHRFEHHYKLNKDQILPSGLQLEEAYSFRRWSTLETEERNEHYEKFDQREDIKKMFLISNYTRRIVPELTHVLYYNQETIGWCIALRSNKNSIEHTLFVLPEHRRRPIVPIALISRNWIAQMRSDFDKAIWLIDAKNGSMLRFMKAKLPHLVHVETSLLCINKNIAEV
ncbi:MAG: GNAT family N-acetyltransferase [Bacteroidota bacterium]